MDDPLAGYDPRRGHNQHDYFYWVRSLIDPDPVVAEVAAAFEAACGFTQDEWDLWNSTPTGTM